MSFKIAKNIARIIFGLPIFLILLLILPATTIAAILSSDNWDEFIDSIYEFHIGFPFGMFG